ncbi:MAG: GNAT family N-acetyltransferase [bacterium]
MHLRVCDDLDEGRVLWQHCWPSETIFDCWSVRQCFADQYRRPVRFLVAEEAGLPVGFLPLAWIEEEGYWGCFPGEAWNGRTWLEQNRIPAASPAVRAALLEAAPEPTRLRYLIPSSLPAASDQSESVDEVGYLFEPGRYDYSFDCYHAQFSGKTRKKLRRELGRLEALSVEYRIDRVSDVDQLYRLNLDAFGSRSYFHDPRFLRSFEGLVGWLAEQGLLRVTTVLVGGHVAAVDLGSVWRSGYTVLAGGTSPEVPGVAKLINFFHLQWACEQRLAVVDFLCGDFSWKQRFHLTPRPLYQLQAPVVADELAAARARRIRAHEPHLQSPRGGYHERLR